MQFDASYRAKESFAVGSDCFICGALSDRASTCDYLKCSNCGHEVLAGAHKQQFMVNDVLDAGNQARRDSVVRFQSAIVRRVKRNNQYLIDVGAGSGKFLYHNRHKFTEILGVEISGDSFRYATEQLSLPIRKDLPQDLRTPSVVTFWHSLEHIPADAIGTLLGRIQSVADAWTRIIISVPNNASFQYQFFREHYPYYDVPNHLHQFSPRSLDFLLKRYGFEREQLFFSLGYVLFGYVQGLLNFFVPIHNYYYYRRKRGETFDLSPVWLTCLDLCNIIILPPLILLSIILSTLDFMFRGRQGVLTVCYRKSR